jgi:hypothetical protein
MTIANQNSVTAICIQKQTANIFSRLFAFETVRAFANSNGAFAVGNVAFK